MNNLALNFNQLQVGQLYNFQYDGIHYINSEYEGIVNNELSFGAHMVTTDPDEQGITWDIQIPLNEAQNMRFHESMDGYTTDESMSGGKKRKTSNSKKSRKTKTKTKKTKKTKNTKKTNKTKKTKKTKKTNKTKKTKKSKTKKTK
jgi:stringent starvation protein B